MKTVTKNSKNPSQPVTAKIPVYRGRDIPWDRVVTFHKEIVARAERSFFALPGNFDQDERWSSLDGYSPESLDGPWTITTNGIHSRPFRQESEQGQHETIYLGGPCYLDWTRTDRGKLVPVWQPLLFREVEIESNRDRTHIKPLSGRWSMSPLFYSLSDRFEIDLGESLDDFASMVVERASFIAASNGVNIGDAIMGWLTSQYPDLEDRLLREVKANTFKVRPSNWVLFAPTKSFSAITRNLYADFEALEEQVNKGERGGFWLLEDDLPQFSMDEVDVLPVVPLNDAQRKAVKSILAGKSLTVVSGPPGTGKSQVVVSALLNAWANGQTVLFASNNNKAVDVVRERVERFESEFPIAARAGGRKHNNVGEILNRTIKIASMSAGQQPSDFDPVAIRRKRDKLFDRRHQLEQILEEGTVQRIYEARQTALRAYATYRSTLATIYESRKLLVERRNEMGIPAIPLERMQSLMADYESWISQIGPIQEAITKDQNDRATVEARIEAVQVRRNQQLVSMGLQIDEHARFEWLQNGLDASLVNDWESEARTVLGRPLDERLEPIEWNDAFDFWSSSKECASWSEKVVAVSSEASALAAEHAPFIRRWEQLNEQASEHREKLGLWGVAETVELDPAICQEWRGLVADLSGNEPSWKDQLPFSTHRKIQKRLREIESTFRKVLSLKVWNSLGVLDQESRGRLGELIELVESWQNLKSDYNTVQGRVKEVVAEFTQIRKSAGQLKLAGAPVELDTAAWRSFADKAEQKARAASAARAGWLAREAQEEARSVLTALATSWRSLGRGIPIVESWREKVANELDVAINALGKEPTPESLAKARSALYAGAIVRLDKAWAAAREAHTESLNLIAQRDVIQTKEQRISRWCGSRPEIDLIPLEAPTELPPPNALRKKLEPFQTMAQEWMVEETETIPELQKQSESEYRWACDQLGKAAEMLPKGENRSDIEKILRGLIGKNSTDWPDEDINQIFRSYSPEVVRGKISAIDAQLEQASFDDAKARWLERLRSDDQAVRAVDELEKLLKKSYGKVSTQHVETFKKALKAVPIWTVNAHAAQAIPVSPDLFDIVIIDEASQCTLTNLLPLMYRGKSLCVIGDDQQLPSIPTIQRSEETELLRKYVLEDYINVVGHAENDVYKTACESLPRRRADVLMLEQHFRSHPQISGFSNRYIYLKRLLLKKNPDAGKLLPVAGGVHKKHVSGYATRGQNGSSWKNEKEAEAVLQLIDSLVAADSRNLSIGVVTPFRVQKEFLRSGLEQRGLEAKVLVDTAYGFQGDERDVIIFSPVVAKGITDGSAKWVESPPNLINVAVSRAREALFVVGDFDFCLQRDGILRNLAQYCNDVQLLRDTSEAELELFSWMVVVGWEPQIHPPVQDIEVDFLLKSVEGQKIVVEVDGSQHDDQTEADKARDAMLRSMGYIILRFSAREVLETPYAVIKHISEEMHDPIDIEKELDDAVEVSSEEL